MSKRRAKDNSSGTARARGLSPQGTVPDLISAGDCPQSDSIIIEGLRCWCYVGVPEEERCHRQRILIDITLTTSLKKAGKSDDFRDTVDYAAVAMLAKKIAEGKKFRLVEAMAERIASALLKSFKIQSVEIRIRKFSVSQALSVGVTIFRPQ